MSNRMEFDSTEKFRNMLSQSQQVWLTYTYYILNRRKPNNDIFLSKFMCWHLIC